MTLSVTLIQIVDAPRTASVTPKRIIWSAAKKAVMMSRPVKLLRYFLRYFRFRRPQLLSSGT